MTWKFIIHTGLVQTTSSDGTDGTGRDQQEYKRASAGTFRHLLMECYMCAWNMHTHVRVYTFTYANYHSFLDELFYQVSALWILEFVAVFVTYRFVSCLFIPIIHQLNVVAYRSSCDLRLCKSSSKFLPIILPFVFHPSYSFSTFPLSLACYCKFQVTIRCCSSFGGRTHARTGNLYRWGHIVQERCPAFPFMGSIIAVWLAWRRSNTGFSSWGPL